MPRRCLALWLPRFATDLAARRGGGGRELAVVVQGGRGVVVTAVNRAAELAGARPGMGLAGARALVPGLAAALADPAALAEALERLADWAGRYTPWLALEGEDGLMLDITGCAHLFGGEEGMAENLGARLGRSGLTAAVAIADTPGAARALARFGGGGIVAPGEQRRALAGLPVAALGLDRDAAAGLARVGLRRIGDLYPMPRRGLAARFGLEVGRRLDRALGAEEEPLSPRRPPAPHSARLAFAEPVSAPEQLHAATVRLLDGLCAGLARAGEGARRLELAAWRGDAGCDRPPQRVAVGTSRPTRDAAALLRLLAERLERLDPGPGFEVMALTAPQAEPLHAAQLGFDGTAAGEEDAELAGLVDRLVLRLGEAAVRRPLPQASWWPERAVGWGGALDPFSGPDWPADRPRPLRLLARPEAIEVMAPIPDDPPVMFRWRGAVHKVALAEGPERLEAEWWRGVEGLRDYYRVEDGEGRRYWLYRDGVYSPERPPPWFLHGIFG
ncbi:MAG: DNA polymerase Y family protein [Rhodospirillaceae bacterium]